jgi:hypothetical protein
VSREFEGGVEPFDVDPHAARVQRLAHTVSHLCREFFTRYPPFRYQFGEATVLL